MTRISKRDLTRDEWEWLQRLARGGGSSLMLTTAMANRLKELGLAEQKLGGTGISQEGRRLLASGRRHMG